MAKKVVPVTKKAAPVKKAAPPVSKAVVNITQSKAVAVATDSSMYEQDAGAGLESMSKDDFAIPRIGILQALSPQVNKKDDRYIDGAEPGMFVNSVDQSVYDGEEGIYLMLISYRCTMLEWKPRNKGGGFVADHGMNMDLMAKTVRNDKGANLLPNGNELVKTAEYFCFMVDKETGTFDRIVISLAKTQFKKAKVVNTMMASYTKVGESGKSFVPATYYRLYKATSKPESNDQGNWMGWLFTPDEDVPTIPNGKEMYLAARSFKEAITGGKVKVAAPATNDESVSTGVVDDSAPM